MIVVTGGAGFIGSNLIAAIEERTSTAIALVDILGDGDKWRNVAKRELAALLAPDELFDFLEEHRDEIEAVFHMGARSATTETDADLLVALNVQYTLDLWDWCAANGTRLIYASSAATYGDGRHGFDDDGSVAGLARLEPLNLYGWSKHVVDRRVARLVADGARTPPQWAALKFFNVYGPNEYHKEAMRSVACKLHEEIRAKGRATLFASARPDVPDGGQRRDFVWVGDCCDIMLWLYDNPSVSGLFNVGSGTARSFAELAAAMFDAMGLPAAIDYVPTPDHVARHYQYFTEAPMTRLAAAGYDGAPTSLEDGVRRYVTDYLATADPYR